MPFFKNLKGYETLNKHSGDVEKPTNFEIGRLLAYSLKPENRAFILIAAATSGRNIPVNP